MVTYCTDLKNLKCFQNQSLRPIPVKQLRWLKRTEHRNEVSDPKLCEWSDGAEGKQLEGQLPKSKRGQSCPGTAPR